MSRFAKVFAANAIAAAGLGMAAVALSPSVAAEPIAPPVVPGAPALGMIQDLATNPAGVGAVLQTAATALNGASTMLGAPAPNTLPVSPIPGSLPVSPIPGSLPVSPIPGAPATAPVPAAPAPTGVIGSTVVPLLTQIGVPAQLVNLAPQMPLLGAAATPVAPVAPIAPVAPVAPVTPVSPGTAPLNPLPLLTALP